MIIDKDAAEQREAHRRISIANIAVELAKGFVATENGATELTMHPSIVGRMVVELATELYNISQPPVKLDA